MPQERFVDTCNWRKSAARVAVHRRVADGRFRPVAGCQQQGATDVGEHPDAWAAGSGLYVLQRQVVGIPTQFAADRVDDPVRVALDEPVHVQDIECRI